MVDVLFVVIADAKVIYNQAETDVACFVLSQA